jgi:hypothetical protein
MFGKDPTIMLIAIAIAVFAALVFALMTAGF